MGCCGRTRTGGFSSCRVSDGRRIVGFLGSKGGWTDQNRSFSLTRLSMWLACQLGDDHHLEICALLLGPIHPHPPASIMGSNRISTAPVPPHPTSVPRSRGRTAKACCMPPIRIVARHPGRAPMKSEEQASPSAFDRWLRLDPHRPLTDATILLLVRCTGRRVRGSSRAFAGRG